MSGKQQNFIMYSASHQVSAPINGMNGEIIDGSGTIDPAALNTAASLSAPTNAPSITSPRGIKRSRSPDQYGDAGADGGEHDDPAVHPDEHGRRKRGRPPKVSRPQTTNTSNTHYATPTHQHSSSAVAGAMQTPQLPPQALPNQTSISPPQHSPPSKTTPTKPLVKALPTVRDHTTDTLNEGRDEYLPKEWDDAGEKKVDSLGYLQGGREYKCRTFCVPGRADKLFMLATECARVLGYRDSYLLFNKNRSLYKIIASQPEKDALIHQDILPYSYRSRQIAIVTARSMFRQFGSRVIVNGRRVRDDYWESKARKQGFTEEDLAGEKRPGAAKARDAAAAEAAANAGILPGLGQSDIVYSNAIEGMPHLPPGLAGHQGVSLAPLPMIHLAPTADDPRLREYSSMPRQRQELTGQPYQDRSQPSNVAEIRNQATHTAEFSKILNSQRAFRQKGLEEFYTTPREVPVSSPSHADVVAAASAAAPVSQALQSPQMTSSGAIINPASQQHRNVLAGQQQAQMMTPASQGVYSQQHQPTSHIAAQSPLSNSMHGIRPDALHARTTNAAALSSAASQTPPYGYQSQAQQMWGQPPPQPQHQPPALSPSPHMGMPQYAGQMPQQSPSPHPGNSQQPHPSQSPHNQARPTQVMPQGMQMHPQVAQPGMASMGYQGGVAYSNVPNPRAMYAPAQPPGQQYVPSQATGMAMPMGAGVGIPGWPSPAGGHIQPGQPQQGQSGSPLGGWSSY